MAAKPWKTIKPQPSPGNDVLTGTAGKDRLDGADGDDFLDGLGNDDRLLGGAGLDTLNGGAGSDRLDGEAGADVLAYVAAENLGASDIYEGGTERDTLVLELTRAEWMAPAFQADLTRYLAHLASGSALAFQFTAFDLKVSGVERIEILVDGIELDPADALVSARADVGAAGEDSPSLAFDVLLNDGLAADLIRSVTYSQAGHGSVQLSTSLTDPAAPPKAHFTYTPDTVHWQHLAKGETATDTFTYTVTDADGDTSTATVTVTITGSNDGPIVVAAGADLAGAVDAANAGALLVDAGSFDFCDVDLKDVHTVSVSAPRVEGSAPSGGFGTLTAAVVENPADADATGKVQWRFEADPAALRGLAQGQTVTQIYTVTISDGLGGAVTQDVSITLTGANDAPIIKGETVEGGLEDTSFVVSAASLLGNDGDVDSGATLKIISVGSAANGSVSLNAQGDVVFTPAADFNGVASFSYVVSDEHGATGTATANVTVGAVVKAPSLGVTAAAGDEDTAIGLSIDAALIGSDPGESLSIVIGGVPADALLSAGVRGADGLWRLTPDQLNGLTIRPAANAEADFVLSVTAVASEDGRTASSTQQLAVTVRGINDAPAIDAARTTSTASVTELANNAAGENTAIHTRSGLIAFTDVDAGDLHAATVTAQGSGYVGELTLGAVDPITRTAAWTFSAPDSALDSLAAGQTLTQTYKVGVDDGQGGSVEQVITVTLTGSGDTVPVAPMSGLVFGWNWGSWNVASGFADRNGDGFAETATGTTKISIAGDWGLQEFLVNGLSAGDLDGDGDVDIIGMTDEYGGALLIATNVGDRDGDGVADFVTTKLNFGYDGWRAALVDLNGDGLLDIAAGAGGVMHELINLGDVDRDGLADDFRHRTVTAGSWAEATTGYGAAAGDMNGDGRQDVVLVDLEGGRIELWFNRGDVNGDGQLDYRVQLAQEGHEFYANSVVLGDVDGDGDLDMLVSTWGPIGNEVIYLNDGDQNGDGELEFFAIELLTGGTTEESELIDIDRDGDLDTVSSDLTGAVAIGYNRGDLNGDNRPDFDIQILPARPGFGNSNDGVLRPHSSGIGVGDIDGDGDLDIVTTAMGQHARYFANLGDLDGDGKLEFQPVMLEGMEYSFDVLFLGAPAGSASANSPIGDLLAL